MKTLDILHAIQKDENLKKELITSLLSDEDFVVDMAKAVFTLPCEKIGVKSPGTLGEFFYLDKKDGLCDKKNN